MTVEGGEWWALAWLGGVEGRVKLRICDDFASFFYLFFKFFLPCKSLIFSDLWRLGKRGGMA